MRTLTKLILISGLLPILTGCCCLRWWNGSDSCCEQTPRNPANCCPQPHLCEDKFCNPSNYDLN